MNNSQSGALRQSNPLPTGGKFSKKITMFGLMALVAAGSVLTSCKKESPEAAPELKLRTEQALAPSAGGAALNLTDATGTVEQSSTGSVYTVKNYFVDQGIYSGTNNHRPNGTYFFDFSANDNRKGATSTTEPGNHIWDISLSGTGNADIRINPDVTQGSALKFLNQSFATVIATYTTAGSSATAWAAGSTSATTPFGHNRTVATVDYSADAPSWTIKGWYNYYFANHTLLATDDLTILIEDNLGDVYAVHLISTYENATPVGTPPTNYSWLKFEYKKLP